MKYAYYPGCSLEFTAKEYDFSSRVVSAHLGLELVELEDWNCCGATSAHSTNHLLALALPARNLALAAAAGLDLAVPCSACYSRLKLTGYQLRENPELCRQIEQVAGIAYHQQVEVYSLLEAVVTGVGLEVVAEKVVRPLTGLKAACYYGCLLVRPPAVTKFDDPENPVLMDRLIQVLGGKAVRWFDKTDCCGASLAMSRAEMVTGMVSSLLDHAREAGANAVVTACPLCHANLEMRRREDCSLPVFYFTELMGLSFNLPHCRSWLKKHLVDPLPLLASLAI